MKLYLDERAGSTDPEYDGADVTKALYIGPRGGKYRDPAHKVHWQEGYAPHGKHELDRTVDVKRMLRGNAGIPRIDMPQIRSDLVPEFLEELKAQGVEVESSLSQVRHLKATQSELHADKVAKLANDPTLAGHLSKPVIVSSDGYLLDGHHRWAAMYHQNGESLIPVIRVDLPIHELLEEARGFKKVEFKKALEQVLEKAGPYIGPRGGKWADPKHTIPWEDRLARRRAAKPKKHAKKPKTPEPEVSERDGMRFAAGDEPAPIDYGDVRDGDVIHINPPHGPIYRVRSVGKKERARTTSNRFSGRKGGLISWHRVAFVDDFQGPRDTHLGQGGRIHLAPDTERTREVIQAMDDYGKDMSKGGPFIGPRGGEWADPRHTIPWHAASSETRRDAHRLSTAASKASAHAYKAGIHTWAKKHHAAAVSHEKAAKAMTKLDDISESSVDRRLLIKKHLRLAKGHHAQTHLVKSGPRLYLGGALGALEAFAEGAELPIEGSNPVISGGADFGALWEADAPRERLLLKAGVVAVGPRGGRIVGYGPGHKPIYEGAKAAPGRQPARKPSGTPREKWVEKPDDPVPPFKDTKAKPGTILHRLETGGYGMGTVERLDARGKKTRAKRVYMPPQDQTLLVKEMRPMAHKIAERVRRRFHLDPGQTEDLRQAAMQGLALAMHSYQGDASFSSRSWKYMEEYASLEARRMSSGFVLPRDVHRSYGKYLAARAQAAEKLYRRGVQRDPTSEEIADQWRVTPADLYPDRVKGDQRHFAVPMGEWRLKGPDGKPIKGDKGLMPGKIEWVERFQGIANASHDVKGTDFFQEGHLEAVIPAHEPRPSEVAMGLGEKFALRQQVDEAIDRVGEPHRTVLRMRFGFHDPSGEGADYEAIASKIQLMTKRGAKPLSQRRKVDMMPTLVAEATARLASVIRGTPEYRELAGALPELARKVAQSKQTVAQWLEGKKKEPRFHLSRRDKELLHEPTVHRPDKVRREATVMVSDPHTGKQKRMQVWSVGEAGGSRPITTGEVEQGALEQRAEKGERLYLDLEKSDPTLHLGLPDDPTLDGWPEVLPTWAFDDTAAAPFRVYDFDTYEARERGDAVLEGDDAPFKEAGYTPRSQEKAGQTYSGE